ncbi:hypothetical protein PVK64_03440 [Aliivibrio sp. S4TY2]|uniref:hypothetical protein n=1 Tax=unclassified Aliivibrio TaxID=2645654 RepID=UPI002378B650|nr:MULTISPECIES: hypothetical protein [unclassified Aliivibrio]MDD9155246.1 hypothetical protein [Aliivibrio sp. S4TY2]MDD9159202.1 hypothetical protein [Aliivibrio sp. S4TY1]MDD9163248.1 hypothetical protein [Aliivibrio sp. S4MY2]MDD9167201.1 hypothetical protein [Aliivibrio sp. S4MY4]MDD9184325.1 hypothetical protein [Aliivibrio sp. S4MY3]
MDQKAEKYNKQQSMLYVNHACNIGGNNLVGELLELEPSRVSELKGGRRKLTFKEADILQQEFGLPETSKGYYIEAELFTSEEMRDTKKFDTHSKELHLLRIIQAWNNEETRAFILESLDVHDSLVPDYEAQNVVDENKRKGIEHKNARLMRDFKLEAINALINSPYFSAWCDVIESILSEVSTQDIPSKHQYFKNLLSTTKIDIEIGNSRVLKEQRIYDILKHVNQGRGISIYSDQTEKLVRHLHLLNKVKTLVESGRYSHLVKAPKAWKREYQIELIENAFPQREYVIVGKVVWQSSDHLQVNEKWIEKSILGEMGVDPISSEEGIYRQRQFKSVSMALLFSENYEYYLEVNLKLGENNGLTMRTLIVRISNMKHLFTTLEMLFAFFKISGGVITSGIKAEIADNGGYIPSAIYLK